MRRLSLALISAVSALAFTQIASAADLPRKAPAYMPPPAPVYNWSGFYIGGNAGYGWGQSTDPTIGFTDPTATGFAAFFNALGPANMYPSLDPRGFLGGAQVGYNWQTGPWVLGVEADFQGSDIKDSTTVNRTVPTFVPGTSTIDSKLEWFGTLRGRVGWAANNWLFYGTGGLAYGEVKNSISLSAPTALPPFSISGSSSGTKTGWAVGAGIEYGIGPWSLRGEYLYYDLGRDTVTATATAAPYTGISVSVDQRTAGQIVRGAINYRFTAF